MKWSFSVAVRSRAEITSAMQAQLARVVQNIRDTEKRELVSDDYIKNGDAICAAAEVIASALPEAANRLLSVNVVGQITRRSDDGEIGSAVMSVRVDSVPG